MKKYVRFFALVCLFVVSTGMAEEVPITKEPSVAEIKKAFEKLSIKIQKEKLGRKDCEKLGFKKDKVDNDFIEYEGFSYRVEFRNRSAINFNDITVNSRFFYTEESRWRALTQKSESEQKHQNGDALHLDFKANGKQTAEIGPFIISSSRLQVGYYRMNTPEVVETSEDGICLRPFFTLPSGITIEREISAPLSLSSKMEW